MEDQCFAGHIQEYGGIIVKVCHQRKRNADPLKGNRRKAHVPCKSGPSTDVARTQAHLGNNRAKALASGASPGAAAPPPPPLGPSSLWRLHGGMQRQSTGVSYFIFTKTDHAKAINRWGGLSHHTHHNSRASLPPLVSLYF